MYFIGRHVVAGIKREVMKVLGDYNSWYVTAPSLRDVGCLGVGADGLESCESACRCVTNARRFRVHSSLSNSTCFPAQNCVVDGDR